MIRKQKLLEEKISIQMVGYEICLVALKILVYLKTEYKVTGVTRGRGGLVTSGDSWQGQAAGVVWMKICDEMTKGHGNDPRSRFGADGNAACSEEYRE